MVKNTRLYYCKKFCKFDKKCNKNFCQITKSAYTLSEIDQKMFDDTAYFLNLHKVDTEIIKKLQKRLNVKYRQSRLIEFKLIEEPDKLNQ